MDYGKIAYLKVEELETRIGKIAATVNSAESSGSFCAYYPKYNLFAGEFPLSQIKANGLVNILLKLTVRHDSLVDNKLLKLTVDGMNAAVAKINGQAGEHEYLLMAAIRVDGASLIKIVPDENLNCTLMVAELTAMGGGATLERRLNDWGCDYLVDNGGVAVAIAAIVKDEYIYLCKVYDGAIQIPIPCGRGHILDVCACGDDFCLVYCDDNGNMWGIKYSSDLEEKVRKYIGQGADCVTIHAGDAELLVACLRGGELFSFLCDTDFGGKTAEEKTELDMKADNIKLIKHSHMPMLAVYSGQSSFLKLPLEERRHGDVVRMSSSYSVVAV